MEINVTTSVSLREYIAANGGIGADAAVTLLMPVAEQLRNIHSIGKGHFKVSPDSVTVAPSGARLAAANLATADREFTAPEWRDAEPNNLRADVYSFAALLKFASGEDAVLPEIVNQALAENPDERTANMRLLIDALAPLCSDKEALPAEPAAYVAPETPAPAAAPSAAFVSAPRKKRRFPVIAIVAIALAGVLIAAASGYYWSYSSTVKRAEAGDFAGAEDLLILPGLTKAHDEELLRYIDAGKLMAAGKYGEAVTSFDRLGNYLDAKALSSESSYLLAEQYLKEGAHEAAIELYEKLAQSNYRDSDEKLLDARFAYAEALMEEGQIALALEVFETLAEENYNGADEGALDARFALGEKLLEEGEYEKAETLFGALANEGYPDAYYMYCEAIFYQAMELMPQQPITAYEMLLPLSGCDNGNVLATLADLEYAIYEQGKQYYYDGEYHLAKGNFEAVILYEDSADYLTLIKAQVYTSSAPAHTLVYELNNIFYFEDAASLVLKNDGLGQAFLVGRWEGDGHYFSMGDGGDINYDLPWFDYGDYYYIEDGIFWLHDEDNPSDERALFMITATSPDCILVYCCEDANEYMLYRQ